MSSDERPSKNSYWMSIAEKVATRSHDTETQVGAILVKNDTGMVIASGHNGFVRGAPDKLLPTTRPEKYQYMVHAEENLLAHCARNGIKVDNCTLVITLSPCQKCLRLMWQAGITQVICRDIYRDHTIALADLNIDQESTNEGYIKLTYKAFDDVGKKSMVSSVSSCECSHEAECCTETQSDT
jgi:dCMP deaminase